MKTARFVHWVGVIILVLAIPDMLWQLHGGLMFRTLRLFLMGGYASFQVLCEHVFWGALLVGAAKIIALLQHNRGLK